MNIIIITTKAADSSPKNTMRFIIQKTETSQRNSYSILRPNVQILTLKRRSLIPVMNITNTFHNRYHITYQMKNQ